MRLPSGQREAIYNEEWLPELLRELRKGEGRPITRLIIGIMFAADMARAAGSVAHELDGVRDEEPETRDVDLFDAGAGVDFVEMYHHEYKRVGGVEVTAGATLSASASLTASASVHPAADEPDQEP